MEQMHDDVPNRLPAEHRLSTDEARDRGPWHEGHIIEGWATEDYTVGFQESFTR